MSKLLSPGFSVKPSIEPRCTGLLASSPLSDVSDMANSAWSCRAQDFELKDWGSGCEAWLGVEFGNIGLAVSDDSSKLN